MECGDDFNDLSEKMLNLVNEKDILIKKLDKRHLLITMFLEGLVLFNCLFSNNKVIIESYFSNIKSLT